MTFNKPGVILFQVFIFLLFSANTQALFDSVKSVVQIVEYVTSGEQQIAPSRQRLHLSRRPSRLRAANTHGRFST